MGNYASQTNLERRYGAGNIAAWSNLDNDDAEANNDAVTDAIAEAEQIIDDRLRNGPYAIPLVATSGNTLYQARRWTVTLAAHILYGSRGFTEGDKIAGRMESAVENVHAEIDAILAGQRTLPASRTSADTPQSPANV